jgi:hypothetical protein
VGQIHSSYQNPENSSNDGDSLTREAGGAGDPSLRLKNGSAQDDNAVQRAKRQHAQNPASNDRPESSLFETLTRELLQRGNTVRFQARGGSMSPAIRDGEIVHVTPVIISQLRHGQILLIKTDHGFRVHRLMVADPDKNVFITRGDCGLQDDPPVRREAILGIAESKEVRIGRRIVRAKFTGAAGIVLRAVARGQAVLSKLMGIFVHSRPARTLSAGIRTLER